MKKSTLILGLLLAGTTHVTLAQQTKIYFGLGSIYNSFQDTRFSSVKFSKATVLPELGFSRISDKTYWHANANFFAFNYSFPATDTISYTNLAYNIRFGYLKSVKANFYVGFNWDVLDYYKRQTEFLNNGSDAYKLSSDMYASGKYVRNISKDWQFDFGLDLGLFSVVNTEPSFTANYQQNIIDKGKVTLIDSDTKRPFKLKNMEFKPFWEQFNIRTVIMLNFKRRLSLSYAWDLRSYSDNKGYPVTNARHSMTLRFNFINHLKK